MRDAGYYWVKYKSVWLIAEWCDIWWRVDIGFDEYVRFYKTDDEFEEIIEKRIVRE